MAKTQMMSRKPRVFIEGQPYEVVSRVREGLPLPPTGVTNELLRGIIGRTQRNDKVTLANFVCMNNHMHQLVIPNEPQKFADYYGELQKKITDAVRTLVGRRYLRLWEDRASVIMLAELQDCIRRLVYIFCNPASADLAESIREYAGLNTWEAFTTCEASVDAEVVQEVNWYPVASIPRLPAGNALSARQDVEMLEQLRGSEKAVTCRFVVKPLAWLEPFGITEPEAIEEIRQQVIQAVYETEAALKAEREKLNRRVANRHSLARQPYLKPHVPKARERKIFLICSNRELRVRLLKYFGAIFEQCREAYLSFKEGQEVQWPPGTFLPWRPPKEFAQLQYPVC